MMLGATALGGCGDAGNDKSQEKSAKQSEASGEQVRCPIRGRILILQDCLWEDMEHF